MKNNKFASNLTHGGRYTKLYQVWINMRRRCNSPKSQFYHRYGGRGISVCPEWGEFIVFKKWAESNGYKEGLSIERNNNDGNYEPSNCSWIPRCQQSQNRSSNVIKTIGKNQVRVSDLQESGLSYRAAHYRLMLLSGEVKRSNIDHAGKQAIKEAIENGHRVKEIASYFNKSEQNISGHLRKMGVPKQSRWSNRFTKLPDFKLTEEPHKI